MGHQSPNRVPAREGGTPQLPLPLMHGGHPLRDALPDSPLKSSRRYPTNWSRQRGGMAHTSTTEKHAQWCEDHHTSAKGSLTAPSPQLCHRTAQPRPRGCADLSLQPPGPNATPGLWSKWHRELHHLVDMAQARTTMLGQMRAMSRAMPSSSNDHIIDTYIMGHPVRLMAVIGIITMHRVEVNHDTTLSIMSLQISHMMLIPVSGMVLPPPLRASLLPKVHASPG
jgi:hypothetical protein